MKKLMIMILSVLGFIGLAACNFTGTQNDLFASNEDIYLFSAVSSTSLLTANSPVTSVAYQLSDEDETLVENEVDDINKYLMMMEQFLGQNNGLSTEIVESDRPEYQHKVEFNTVDLLGNQVVHTLYYQEEALETVTDTTTDDFNSTKSETEEEVIEDEQVTKITGLLIMNGLEYLVEGKKEIEDNESKIEMKSFIDEDNYVKVVSKVEDNERKYFYEIVTDGVVTMQSKVKFENEDNETKFVLEYSNGDVSGFFEFKREIDDDEDIIKIKYEINQGNTSESGEVKILVVTDPLTNNTTYQFKIKAQGHQEKHIEKDRNDDYEDSDDEGVDTSI